MFYYKASKATLPVAIFLCLLMLFNLCSSQALAGAGDLELRIMSFNIRYGSANDGDNHWKNRKEMVFDVLRDHKPDIVGLQEALDFQIAEIRKAVSISRCTFLIHRMKTTSVRLHAEFRLVLTS